MKPLLDINPDTAYWRLAYHPDCYYKEIGNYCVFVMDENSCGEFWGSSEPSQNHLYIAKAPNP